MEARPTVGFTLRLILPFSRWWADWEIGRQRGVSSLARRLHSGIILKPKPKLKPKLERPSKTGPELLVLLILWLALFLVGTFSSRFHCSQICNDGLVSVVALSNSGAR